MFGDLHLGRMIWMKGTIKLILIFAMHWDRDRIARMKKKKRTTPKPYTPKLSSVRYSKYLTALLEAQQNAIDNQAFWDVGPGERPQKVQANFRHVAKKENIQVVVEKHENGLIFIFPDPDIIETTGLRIRKPDGALKAILIEEK